MILPPKGGDDGTAAAPSISRELLENLIPTENRADVIARPSFSHLVESFRQAGINAVPVYYSKPDSSGKRMIWDGNGRYFAAIEASLTHLIGIELERQLSEVEMIEFTATHNGVRRSMSPEELAAQAERYMELTGCSQEAAARVVHISASQLSRSLACLLLPEKHRDAARKLSPSTRKLIATQRDASVLDAAMGYATTPTRDGKLPSRDDVTAFIQRQKQMGKSGRTARPRHEIKPAAKDSALASLTVYGDTDPKTLARDLKSLAALVEANAGYGIEAVVAILRGKDRPATATTVLA